MTTGSPMIAVRDSILIFLTAEPLAQALKKGLESGGIKSTIVTNEAAALAEAKASRPAVIVMDRQHATAALLRQWRSLFAVPIVAVQHGPTPCSDDECLQLYERDIDLVVCNQSARELVARVRAIFRRQERRTDATTHYTVGPIRMDLDRHEVTVDRRLVDLTPKEFQILRQFMESPGRVFSRQEMLNRVWGEGYALEEHALDVHIHSLRHKIETDPSSPRSIVTVRGIGYKLRTP
jgi:DNA-binding response OmpR family regulator